MLKVLTAGVFDLFHYGHFMCLKKASKLGDQLIVAVHDDKEFSKGIEFVNTLEQRLEMVASHRMVSITVPYERIDKLVREVEFDILAHGPDQNHQYFQAAFEWCRENGKQVIEIPRTEGISSSAIRHTRASLLAS